MESKARAAYNELLDVLREAGERYAGPESGVTERDDVAEGLRNLSHILQSGLYAHQEFDPQRPVFRRIVSPTRSFTGDNPDAVYYEAPVAGGQSYVITGNIAGAVYTSFTMEAGAVDGKWSAGTAGILRDDDIDVAADGSYRIRVGGDPAERNWLGVPAEGGRLTTRHYFEWPEPAAASQTLCIPLAIDPVTRPPAPPRWDDESVAAALQRVVNHVREKTIPEFRPPRKQAAFSTIVPNQFPQPAVPGNMAFAAFDAAYSSAPYRLAPDEALVITGRWPECRFANLCLWNRFQQMYDYVNRTVSRNRANTTLEPDGTFRMIVAHEDPGLPNWLDTEGRGSGVMFWRFFLPESDIETPQAKVVKFSQL
jgi:hypothetical protein